jgi:RNA polymerase sigma-70 factor (ECF subfamily)
MNKRDEDLMTEFQLGQEEAMNVIFQRYKKPVFNFALRMLANRADAEDVTGDVFLILFSKKYSPQPDVKFSTWLFTVVRNNCIDRIRKRDNVFSLWFRRQGEENYEEFDLPDTQPIPSEALEQKLVEQRFRKVLTELPLEQREALILREFQQMSYHEISQVLACSLDKVKILIFRAREKLRGKLSAFTKEGF